MKITDITLINEMSYDQFKAFFKTEIDNLNLNEDTLKDKYNNFSQFGVIVRVARRNLINLQPSNARKSDTSSPPNMIYKNRIILGSKTLPSSLKDKLDENGNQMFDENGEIIQYRTKPFKSIVYTWNTNKKCLEQFISVSNSPKINGGFESNFGKLCDLYVSHYWSKNGKYENFDLKKIDNVRNLSRERLIEIFEYAYELPEYIVESEIGKAGNYKARIYYGIMRNIGGEPIFTQSGKKTNDNYHPIQKSDDSAQVIMPCFNFRLRNKSIDSQSKIIVAKMQKETYGRFMYNIAPYPNEQFITAIRKIEDVKEALDQWHEMFQDTPVFIVAVPISSYTSSETGIEYINFNTFCVVETEFKSDQELETSREIQERLKRNYQYTKSHDDVFESLEKLNDNKSGNKINNLTSRKKDVFNNKSPDKTVFKQSLVPVKKKSSKMNINEIKKNVKDGMDLFGFNSDDFKDNASNNYSALRGQLEQAGLVNTELNSMIFKKIVVKAFEELNSVSESNNEKDIIIGFIDKAFDMHIQNPDFIPLEEICSMILADMMDNDIPADNLDDYNDYINEKKSKLNNKVEQNDDVSPMDVPTIKWKKDDIQNFMDKNEINYNKGDTKKILINKIENSLSNSNYQEEIKDFEKANELADEFFKNTKDFDIKDEFSNDVEEITDTRRKEIENIVYKEIEKKDGDLHGASIERIISKFDENEGYYADDYIRLQLQNTNFKKTKSGYVKLVKKEDRG